MPPQMFYCTWLRNVPADSISERVVFDELGEPVIGCLRRALERLEINVDHTEAATVAFCPLKIIEQGPNEISAQSYTCASAWRAAARWSRR